MTLNDWAKEIHQNAVAHGWWEEDRGFGEVVALCHSELSEALEEYRDGKPNAYVYRAPMMTIDTPHKTGMIEDPDEWCGDDKPEGIAVEMIDCVIRILDWCGKEGIDVDRLLEMKHEYNRYRPYRHGGKKI